eukprot:TRINITY_DN50461_c0_g1_i1.p1 TRINITY_DN50461_c0_g1~~TRINITY_DN50461_c0_g1_i1.p1  ORF type:complete len:288 (-),score=45.79 TRINITY_DN50461_c0_g1_i1:335-1120(-)
MAQHKVTYKSTGCLPSSSGINSVSKEDLVRLTYRTTYGTGVAGRIPSAEDKGENFSDIHMIGRKESPYMKFQKSTAPLLDHSACTNKREYTVLPLGDNKVNAMLAASFKGGLKGGAAGSNAEMLKSSSYKDTFISYGTDRSLSAKPPSQKPKSGRTKTITGMTDMLETKPTSHVSFHAHPTELAKAGAILIPKPNIGLTDKWGGPVDKSSYHSEFCGPFKRSHSTPNMSMADLELGRTEDLLPGDHQCFNMRRLSYMSPGQ